MNEELKHHAKGLARELKKVAEEFLGKSLPNDFSFEGEAKMKVRANGKTYERTASYSAAMSTIEVNDEDSSTEALVKEEE